MWSFGDRVFESTLGKEDRVSLEETTLEEGTRGVGGDDPWRVASDLSYCNSQVRVKLDD